MATTVFNNSVLTNYYSKEQRCVMFAWAIRVAMADKGNGDTGVDKNVMWRKYMDPSCGQPLGNFLMALPSDYSSFDWEGGINRTGSVLLETITSYTGDEV
jgi:hypothetical protein